MFGAIGLSRCMNTAVHIDAGVATFVGAMHIGAAGKLTTFEGSVGFSGNCGTTAFVGRGCVRSFSPIAITSACGRNY